jgi:CheY-like chemotaxis protein
MTLDLLEILLVEDHRDSGNVLAKLLRPLCRRVTVAPSCTAAIDAFEIDPGINFLILDLGLPDGDGCDLLRKLEEIRKVPAIALTAYAMQADLDRTAAAGFLEHLAKPVSFATLKETIERVAAAASPAAQTADVAGHIPST